MSKINYLGKRKNGTVESVANRLKVSTSEIQDLKANPIRYIVNQDTGDISKIDISKSPLLIREFGVKKLNSKLITGGMIKKGFFVSKDPIPLNVEVTGTIYSVVRVTWDSSGGTWEKEHIIEVEKQVLTSIESVIQTIIEQFFELHPGVENDVASGAASIEIKPLSGNVEDASMLRSQKLEMKFIARNETSLLFKDMVLKGSALNLTRIYGEDVDLNKTTKDNCVYQYMAKRYPKITTLSKWISKDGATPEQMKEFCIKYKITMKIFNVSGNIVESNYPAIPNQSYPRLIGIAYNNHFYPIKNLYLHKLPKVEIVNTVFVDKLEPKLTEILKSGEYPSYVGMHNDYITDFQIGDTVYHNNKDYDICLEILTLLGLKSSMTYFINKQNIHKVIEPLFIKTSVDSFFPYNSGEAGYNYVNKEFNKTKSTISLDHNKHFSDALRKLNNLVKIDIKTAKHIMNPTKLEEGYFYIAKPLYSNVLINKTGFYPYDFLKYCKKEGVAFELVEAISCEYKENYYTDMINTLYEKLSNENFKFVVNCMIGAFEKKSDERTEMSWLKIANQDETKTTDKYVKKLDDEYNLIYDVGSKANSIIFNKVPIRVQVLCEARRIIYEKIKELKLKPADIKQIRCDSITFTYKKKIIEGKEIGEWKLQDSKPLSNDLDDAYDPYEPTFKLPAVNETNTIYIDYAGSGKTHYIVNELIPKLNDFIVVSPSHASIREYRSKKINCNVIQKYCFSNTIPTEKNIIVDEIGMLDSQANNIIAKCALMGKNIYSFGDMKQLKPVNGEPCDSPIYLNYIYANINKLGTNYRNNFTFEYYDSLIAMTKTKDILAEINKHNSKSPEEAETIITYTNATRQKFNKKMITKLGIDYDTSYTGIKPEYKIKTPTIGCKIMCNSNLLSEKNIYNNFYYNIKAVEGSDITITDGLDDIVITEKQLKKFFDFGYCRTLYNIQGESITSFYFPVEDIPYIDGRALYTLVSRLKK